MNEVVWWHRGSGRRGRRPITSGSTTSWHVRGYGRGAKPGVPPAFRQPAGPLSGRGTWVGCVGVPTAGFTVLLLKTHRDEALLRTLRK